MLEKLKRRVHLEHLSIYDEDNIKMVHRGIWYKEYLQDLAVGLGGRTWR
jgi:hypothetical protein